MFGQARDPLQEALNSRKLYSMPANHSKFFKTSKMDLEHFGMSFSQRVIAFITSLAFGLVLFFYSLSRLLFLAFNPAAFVAPYVLSNFIFFFMFGFLSGFRTYFRNLLSKSKRNFTLTFIATTAMAMYVSMVLKSRFYNLIFAVVQIVSFICFLITFLPGGSSGLTSLINMFIK